MFNVAVDDFSFLRVEIQGHMSTARVPRSRRTVGLQFKLRGSGLGCKMELRFKFSKRSWLRVQNFGVSQNPQILNCKWPKCKNFSHC